MKISTEKIPQCILTRGNSEKLDSGDLVAYLELVPGEEDKRVFRPDARRIERVTRQNGLRTFVISGPLKSQFVGGPLLGGGNTVVGIVTKVGPGAGNTSTFYALDIQTIPKFPKRSMVVRAECPAHIYPHATRQSGMFKCPSGVYSRNFDLSNRSAENLK